MASFDYHGKFCATYHLAIIIVLVVIMLSDALHPTFLMEDEAMDLKGEIAQHNLYGRPGEGYYIQVLIGTPEQKFNVLVDTGSSNFAIASAPSPEIDRYFVTKNSSTYQPKNLQISVLYTQGYWEGVLGNDRLLFPSLLSLPSVSCDIAGIHMSHNFYINGSNWQGILGLAYSSIARPDSSVISWLDALSSVKVKNMTFCLQLCGGTITHNSTHSGIFKIGPPDTKLYSGDIFKTPIHQEWFYDVLLTNITVNSIPVSLPCTELNTDKTIVDSGTTNLRLPQKVFSAVVDILNSSVTLENVEITDTFWHSQDVLCWDTGRDLWKYFPNITLSLAASSNTSFAIEITSQSYIREVFDAANDQSGQKCYKFAIDPSKTGTVLGVVVLEGFYVVFNRSNKTVGFAKSTCGPPVRVHPPRPSADTWSCAYVPPTPKPTALEIAAYVLAGLMSLCAIPLIFFLCSYIWMKFVHPRLHSGSSDSSLTITGNYSQLTNKLECDGESGS